MNVNIQNWRSMRRWLISWWIQPYGMYSTNEALGRLHLYKKGANRFYIKVDINWPWWNTQLDWLEYNICVTRGRFLLKHEQLSKNIWSGIIRMPRCVLCKSICAKYSGVLWRAVFKICSSFTKNAVWWRNISARTSRRKLTKKNQKLTFIFDKKSIGNLLFTLVAAIPLFWEP